MKLIAEAFGKRIEESGLTRIQWVALYYLNEKGLLRQKELSKLMNVKDSSVGRLLDRLERDGLIERRRCQEDKRAHKVALTDAGKKVIIKYLSVGSNFSAKLVEGLTENELKTFEKVLDTMVKNVID